MIFYELPMLLLSLMQVFIYDFAESNISAETLVLFAPDPRWFVQTTINVSSFKIRESIKSNHIHFFVTVNT